MYTGLLANFHFFYSNSSFVGLDEAPCSAVQSVFLLALEKFDLTSDWLGGKSVFLPPKFEFWKVGCLGAELLAAEDRRFEGAGRACRFLLLA